MNPYIIARTNAINCYGSSGELKILQQMFPLGSNNADTLQSLEKYFDPSNKQHVRYLQQKCFKSSISQRKIYEEFRRKKHPEITQAPVSTYFNNDDFPSLVAIQKWLQDQGDYPYFAKPDNLKQQIACVLQGISQQFGYIPNLQRFLLYYPNYLIKIQKFRSLFFQQHQVTHISPKNCCFAGLIAAIEVGCPYMIARMTNSFLVRNGNIQWITQKKYPEQFKPLFNIFRKIAVAPWSINQSDLQFNNTNWSKQVYFDYIVAGMFVMSMSTICIAMGLVPDQPCKYFPLQTIQQIKGKYDEQKYESLPNKKQLIQQVKQMINSQRQLTKQYVQQIQSKQIEPYMKQIGAKLSTYDLYISYNKLLNFLVPEYTEINIKAKNNSFFHRYRDVIEKGLLEEKKISKISEEKFNVFRDYCVEGSTMTFNNFGKKEQNTRNFRKLIQIMTYNHCGYHRQFFDYKKNIKLNTQLTMPLKFYIRLLSICPLYINKQVLLQVNHQIGSGWVECFDLGHLAIMVAENKVGLLVTSMLAEIFK